MTTDLTSAAVVGLGTAGTRLAVALARAGLTVTAVAPVGGTGRDLVRLRAASGAVGRDTADAEVLDRIRVTDSLTALPPVDIVVEAVPEDADAKRAVVKFLDQTCGPDTVVASTASAVPLSELASHTTAAHRVIGLRMAGPPHGAKLVELTHGPDTAPEVLARARTLVRRMGLAPVPVAAGIGTPLSRLLFGLLNQSVWMLHRGYASAQDIDSAMVLGCGLPAGPFRFLDDIGLDTAVEVLDALYARTGHGAYRAAPLLRELVAAGRLGRKSGGGFHDQPAGDPPPPVVTGDDPERPDGPRTCRVGVVGSGTMATGIAETLLRAGYRTTVVARSRSSLDRVTAALAAAGVDGERCVPSTSLTDLAECDLVIEAVAEDLTVKRELLARLDAVCGPDAVLATGTSSLSVTRCAEATGRPDRVVGLHFFNPVPAMRLVELVSTAHTHPAATARAENLCRHLGRRVVRCGDEPGFVVNRLLFPYLNQAVGLLGEGWSANDIDRAVKLGTGLPMGPFRLLDVVGADIALAVQESLAAATGDPALAPDPLLVRLVADGYLGSKVGRGVRDHPDVA